MPKYRNIFAVDLANGEARRVNLGTLHQGDKYANRVGAIVTDNGVPVDLGGTGSAFAVLSNNLTVPMTNGVVSGNLIYCDLIDSCYAVEGPIVVKIKWTDGTEKATILSGQGYVSLSETDTPIDPGDIIPSVEALIDAIEEAEQSIPQDYSDLSANMNALTHFDLPDSGYINGSGAELANSDYHRTGYIPVNSDSLIILNGFYVGSMSGSAYAYYFYTSDKTPISGANGITTRTIVDTIPGTAAYVRFSSRTSQGETPVAYVSNHVVADVVKLKKDVAENTDDISDLKTAMDATYVREQRGYVRISTGFRLAESSGYCAQNADYNLIKFPVTAGDIIYVVCDDRMQFQTDQSTPTSGARNRVGDTYGAGTYHLIVPDTATWLVVSTPATGSTAQFFIDIPAGDSIKSLQNTETLSERTAYLNWTKGDRNVSGDIYTANMSASGRIPLQNILSAYATRRTRIHAWDKTGTYLGRIAADDTLTKSSGTVTRHYLYDLPITQIKTLFPAIYAVSFIVVPEGDETVSDYRVFAQNNLSVRISHDSDDVAKWLDNAYFVANNTTTPALKLLHISDIHANKAALDRINQKVGGLLHKIDGKICTGDMVYNTAGEIASWWDASYMTAIGNHDTWDGNNWTALSVADRIAYYISPFEENWGITRPSGCSYYYKDYTTQKVRLIVLDGMLYVSGGADATAQTTWLGDTIDAAITAGYHVLIAIHAPHNGAAAVPCTFSDVTAITYSGNANICNTPQAVIDLVATKIAGGLNFIGYLVGHTHRDGIWKVTDDGTQMMYCVTCGTDTLNSDQMREVAYSGTNRNSSREFQFSEGAYYDAANLVVIDTAHSLIKLIRVGGADRDIYMRPRRAICFRYSDGTLMGENK